MITRYKDDMKHIEQKQKEAQARQAAYDALTTAQKLAQLDKAFGVGKGAAKERAKLLGEKKSPVVVAELPDGKVQVLNPDGSLTTHPIKQKFKKGQSHRSVEKKS